MRIIILGPTAAGKTELSLRLAEHLNTDIISADSRQCYKKMNIGTATPSEQELQRVKHFNISILELEEEDNAMEFQRRAMQWESQILRHAKHVLYVGGSTLHVQCLIQPFNEMPEANEENLQALNDQMQEKGIGSLYAKLEKVDPDYAEKMEGMNTQRILRALDVWMQTGKPFSSFHQQEEIKPDPNTLVFGVRWPRQKLYERINRRVDQMIAEGLVEEVRDILSQGYDKDLNALNTVGYSEIINYLEGSWSLDKAVEKIKTSTRRYAKRQMTWYKRWEFVHWLDADRQNLAEMADIILKEIHEE